MPPVPHPATSAACFFPSPVPRGLAGRVARLSRRTLIVIQFAVCLAPVEGLAQSAAQLTPRDLRPPAPLVAPAALPPSAPLQEVAPQPGQDLLVRVDEVVIEDGFADLREASVALAAAVRGQRLPVSRLYQLAEAIEALYQDAGYALVRITLPPQELLDGGVLRLLALDGHIESLDLSGVDARARARVAAVLAPLVGQRRLQADVLARALTLAERGPGVTLRSTLRPGAGEGGVVLTIEASRRLVGASVSADNRLASTLGPWQSNLQASLNQAFGWGEQVYLYASSGADLHTAYRGDARRSVRGGGVTLPIGADGWSINPEYTHSLTQPQPQAFLPRTLSEFERYTLRLSYPLILSRSQELTFNGALEASSQTDRYPDFGFTLDAERLRVARLGLAWSGSVLEGARLTFSGTLSKGLTGVGVDYPAANPDSVGYARSGANPGFAKIEVTAGFDASLPHGLQARSALRAQRTLNGILPSAELFSLDGEDALSTLSSGALSDDRGWTARQEVSAPRNVALAGAPLTLAPYAFGAAGRLYTELALGTGRGLSKSWGLGLRGNWREASLALEYGRTRSSPNNLNRSKLVVKAQVQF
jgi:hemolysin activation/secretion protein